MEELQQNKSALEGSGKPLLKNTNFLFLWAATLFSSFALAFFYFFTNVVHSKNIKP